MATVPTGKMERELRRLYMQWVNQLPNHERDLHNYVAKFQKKSLKLIEKMGGNVARLGALAGFPAPRELDLSPHIGTIYSDMELAAIKAQISLGLNPRQTAEALQRAGVDKSFRRLERLARTETVSAYWKNAWDSIDGLGLVMVWGAENGPRTCQWCHDRDGMVMDSPDLRDHPNGRCTPLPTHPSQVDYRGSVRADGQIYQDPAWTSPVSLNNSFDDERLETGSKAADSFLYDYDLDKLNYFEKAAWTEYVDGDYVSFNKLYRDPADFAKTAPASKIEDFSKKSKDLESLFTHSKLPTETITYRGVAATEKFNPGLLQPGQSFSDPGLFSTSAARSVAEDFRDHMSPKPEDGWLFIVKSPKGTSAIPGLVEEAELLLRPGQMQRVVQVDPTTRLVYLEVIP